MTDNPNAKYGFGPKTRDGRDVVITGEDADNRFLVGLAVRHWPRDHEVGEA